MQVDTQDFLDMVEETSTLYTWDIESHGFNADYGQAYMISIKPFGKKPVSFAIGPNMNDKQMVIDAAHMLNQAKCWMTYYGKGFDVKFVNTRLLLHGEQPLNSPPHLDLYYALKPKLKTSRKSLGHLLNFFEMEDEKMTVSPNVWAGLAGDGFNKNIKILRERCESDCVGLESLYSRTRHLIKEVRK